MLKGTSKNRLNFICLPGCRAENKDSYSRRNTGDRGRKGIEHVIRGALKYFFILFIMIFSMQGMAQLYTLHIASPENRVVNQWQNEHPKTQDSISWVIARNDLISNLHREGFLMASIEKWQFENDSIFMSIEPGRMIHWAKMKFNALEFLPRHWVNDLDQSGKAVQYNEWHSIVRGVLKAAQSEGYLFARYKLNVLGLKNDSLETEVIFDPGLQIVLDTIEVEGNARLSQSFLQKTLGIKRGEPITPADLELLQQQLGNLRFVQQTSPPVLILLEEQATIRAYLSNRNASSFDILAGILPASGPEQPVTLTGYVELDLINQLARGERIYLHLEKLRPRSQELEMTLGYPYLLDLPFGVSGDFRLLKNDTLYSELEWKGGITLPFGKNQFIRAGVTQQATNIITVNRNTILATKKLPPYVDLRVKGLTMGVSRNRLDYDVNPRKGYSIVLDAAFSQRSVKQNDLITGLSEIDTSFNYASLYDSLQDRATRVSIEGAFQYFIPWGSRSTIRLALDGGALTSGERLFTNEMFRLGGYEKLRGFDEESILAQFYSILTTEYRLIIGGAGYISFFGDYAWINNEDVDTPFQDRPFGFGFGLNFETNAGIFGMRAAVGAQRGNPIDFDDARLHFGYVNRF